MQQNNNQRQGQQSSTPGSAGRTQSDRPDQQRNRQQSAGRSGSEFQNKDEDFGSQNRSDRDTNAREDDESLDSNRDQPQRSNQQKQH